jgi:alcohol dehydrogenase
MPPWSFQSSQFLHFGRGALAELPRMTKQIAAKRVLIITDAMLESLGLVDRVIQSLMGYDVAVDATMTPEPPDTVIVKALEAAKAFRPDAVIGFGGGSNMDAAKLIAVCLAHGGEPRDWVGDCRVPGPIVPLICIPTTAGTGSEVSAAAVFTDAAAAMKVSCLSPFLRPFAAIIDPSFTDGCPAKITADSGIDALTHAIEAYSAAPHAEFVLRPPGGMTVYQGKNPLADAMAEQCIRRVAASLRTAVHTGRDTAARDEMALAATLGGLAFSNAGVALVHAMEYPVGGAVHVSHGAGNGLLLPFIMAFNKDSDPEAFARIGTFLGTRADADAAIDAVVALRKDIGIPLRLRDIGVIETQLPGFAAKAFAIKRLMRVNPRMPTEAEILAIYQAAY